MAAGASSILTPMMIIAIITIICLAGSHVEGFLFASPSSTTIHHHLDRRDHRRNQHPRKHHQFDDSSTMLRMSTGKEDDDDDDEEEAQKILGNTWFAKSSSSSIISDNTIQNEDDSVSPQQIEYYDVGISGTAFQTGALSQRMYATMCSQMSIDIETPAATTTKDNDNDNDTTDIQKALMLYALDFTAKEATSAALEQLYGMDLFEVPQQANVAEEWGTIEAIRGVPHDDDKSKTNTYQSIEDVIEHGNWIPGQSFDFIVRNVPTKSKSMTEELVQALDPDGKLRKEANELRSSSSSSSSEEEKEDDTSTTSTTTMNTDDDDDPSIDEEALLSIFDEEIGSLSEMATDNIRRTEEAPRGSTDESQAYSGLTHQRGYKIINRKDLVSSDATENEQTLIHVMNALVAHGVLIVDLTDGGESFHDANMMARMWETVDAFFTKVTSSSSEQQQYQHNLPGMTSVMETGSQHAMVGYSEYDSGSMKFLETRLVRRERGRNGENKEEDNDDDRPTLLPKETKDIIGRDGIEALQTSFDLVTDIGKDIIRIAVGASSVEHGAFLNTKKRKNTRKGDGGILEDENSVERNQEILARQGAKLLVEELVDDGKPLYKTTTAAAEAAATPIDHTEGNVSMSPFRLCRYTDTSVSSSSTREVFGAHTDTSFVTIVPVSNVSGLEVFDEAAECWYRPELRARNFYLEQEEEQLQQPRNEESTIPWHCRYVAILPGENLQLATRNEIPAAVHRVVAMKETKDNDNNNNNHHHHNARLSAPILLRGRPGTKFLADRYIGGSLGNPLIMDADELSMEDIHDKNQPKQVQ